MRNNKGFTLIEMLVVIAIIVALSVSAGLSADFSLKKAKKNEYKDRMWELFNAVSIYSELSDFETVCTASKIKSSSGCTVQISDLIAKGLVDEKILEQRNPIYKKNKNFTTTTKFIVKKINGVKTIDFKCGTGTATADKNGTKCVIDQCIISIDTLEDYHKNDYWEQC